MKNDFKYGIDISQYYPNDVLSIIECLGLKLNIDYRLRYWESIAPIDERDNSLQNLFYFSNMIVFNNESDAIIFRLKL